MAVSPPYARDEKLRQVVAAPRWMGNRGRVSLPAHHGPCSHTATSIHTQPCPRRGKELQAPQRSLEHAAIDLQGAAELSTSSRRARQATVHPPRLPSTQVGVPHEKTGLASCESLTSSFKCSATVPREAAAHPRRFRSDAPSAQAPGEPAVRGRTSPRPRSRRRSGWCSHPAATC